ncbi:MAG TPA: PilZ domain-containing protein [Terriglobales bacterium]|nr:PilZ domain-containing protein [Terriglobales bacterium]
MAPKLIDAIANRLCSHEFAWPRRRTTGDYYQVCVLCGAEYLYDWNSMTRTGRIEHGHKQELPGQTLNRSRRRSNWRPRARRLRLNAPLTFRKTGAEEWNSGVVQNISQSGVLFHASQSIDQDADVEMIFEMPEEITGQPNSRVLCNGYVVRAMASKASSSMLTFAVAISGYTFLHDKM